MASQSFNVTVEKPPTTSVLLPSNGATMSGSTVLDASASNATSVEFRLFGGIYGYAARCSHGYADHLRMAVWLEHHDGPQRFLYLLSEAFGRVEAPSVRA